MSYLYSFVVYLYVSRSGSITSVWEERELICLLLFTFNYVVSVRRGFLFLLLLGIGCVILLWHSLGLSYNYFEILSPDDQTRDPQGLQATVNYISWFIDIAHTQFF